MSDAGPDATGRELVLYRCPTPTDVLCPCGAVARQLRRLGIPYRVERVPYRRSGRPEIIELTGQSRVPLLIDEEEIVYDSKRIREYLEWRYPDGAAARGSGDDRREAASG